MEPLRNVYLRKFQLGDYSPDYQSSIIQYVSRLEDKNLPVIFDSHHLASLIGLEYRELQWILNHRKDLYKYFVIKKKNGGDRRILAPYHNLKRIQKWILNNILDCLETPEYVTGFEHGRSILHNAKFHEDRNVIMKIDLKNFFESIDFPRVYGFFHSLGYGKQLSFDLALLCTTEFSEKRYNELPEEHKHIFDELKPLSKGFIVQGSPASPSIANHISRMLDVRFKCLADKNMLIYSRYADDITFSAASREYLPKIGTIRHVVESEGFALNEKKIGIYNKSQHQSVTGLLIDGSVHLSSKYKRDIFRHLYFCKKYGPKDHFERFAPGKSGGQYWLYGRICFVNSIEPQIGKQMLKIFDEINWL